MTGPQTHRTDGRSAADSAAGHPGTAPAAAIAGAAQPDGPGKTRTDTLFSRSDSLTGYAHGATDSLAAFFPASVAADSLTTASPPSVWRDTTAAAVFGQTSLAVQPGRIPPAPAPSLTDNAVFQGFVLLLAATYAMLLYRNLSDVFTLLGRVSRDTATGERLSEDTGGSGFSRFLNIATAIGMLFMGVVVVKYGDSLMPNYLTELFSHGAVLAMSLLATLAWCAVALFQLATVRMAGAVTLSQPFISQLVLLKRTYFSLAVIVTSPALLLFALCPRGTGNVWFCVVAIELAVAAILYFRETLNLFLAKKISILHWFLYLCIVEVFPISLLWLIAIR